MQTASMSLPCICGDLDVGRQYLAGTNHRHERVDIRLCKTCGVGRSYPVPEIERLEATVYRSADDFTIRHVHFERTKAYYDDLIRELTGLVQSPSKRLLDVGCSVGSLLAQARKRGFETVGLEINPLAAEYARTQFGLDVRTDRIDDLVRSGERFDVVTLTQVIEHLPRPQQMLSIAVQALRPGGVVVVEVPNMAGAYARLLGRFWPAWSPTQHIWHFTRDTIENLERYGDGFRMVSAHTRRCIDYHFVPTPLRPIVAMPGMLQAGDNLTAVFTR